MICEFKSWLHHAAIVGPLNKTFKFLDSSGVIQWLTLCAGSSLQMNWDMQDIIICIDVPWPCIALWLVTDIVNIINYLMTTLIKVWYILGNK